jgi:hypothetical protein
MIPKLLFALGAASHGINRIIVNSTIVHCKCKLNEVINVGNVVLMKHKLTSPVKITQYYERTYDKHEILQFVIFATYSHPFFPDLETWNTKHMKTTVQGQFPLVSDKLAITKYSKFKDPITYDDMKIINIDYKLNPKYDYFMKEFTFDANTELYLLGQNKDNKVEWTRMSLNPYRLLYTKWDYGLLVAFLGLGLISSIY